MKQANREYKSLVKVDNLSVVIGKNNILSGVNLQVNANQIVVLIGPNGAGKSTLIKAILGLVPVSSGSIELLPKVSIGYMPQKLFIDKLMPLQQNLAR